MLFQVKNYLSVHSFIQISLAVTAWLLHTYLLTKLVGDSRDEYVGSHLKLESDLSPSRVSLHTDFVWTKCPAGGLDSFPYANQSYTY